MSPYNYDVDVDVDDGWVYRKKGLKVLFIIDYQPSY